MKLVLSIVFCLLSLSAFSQNRLIQTGRPMNSFDQNVKEIAAQKFKIEYIYVAFKGIPEQLDSINTENSLTYAKLSKKYGEDWQEQLTKMEQEERTNLSLFQSLLIKENRATRQDEIQYSKSKCGKSYTAKIKVDASTSTTRKVKMKVKDGKVVLK